MKDILYALWAYRGFIRASVIREFRLKISGSALGAWWMILAPLSQVLMYAVVLTGVMKTRLPGAQSEFSYAIYLLAGMAGWSFFSEIITRGTNMFIENANLLKKLAFPRLTLPVIVSVSASINHGIFLAITILLTIVLGHGLGWQFVALLPLALITTAFALSIGVLMGVLNVFYRDVGYMMGIIMQFWFWATPIVYTKDILPERLQPLMQFNPAMPFIDGYHRIIYLHQWPDWEALGVLLICICLLASFSYSIFRRAQGELVDAL